MSIALNHFSDLAVLETERLILKPLNRYFLSQDYVNWMNDEKVNQHLESGGDYTLEKLTSYLKEVEDNPKYFWAINLKETDQHLGNIKIDPIDLNLLWGEYGIMIGDRNAWGKGIAKEASKTVINFCFKTLNLNQINLGVKKNNLKAISLYEKLGFKINPQSTPKTTTVEFYRMSLINPNLA